MRTVYISRFFFAVSILGVLASGCSKPAGPAAQSEDPDEAFIRSVRGVSPEEAQASSTAAANPAAAAKIELPTTRYDMGLIENDRIAVQRMPILNRGEAPLKVTKVSTSCGCTTGEMESAIIAPGGEGTLIIRVDPAKIPGFFAEKTLTLYTNDPVNPTPSLNVVSHVKPELEFIPEVLEFGTISKGEGAVFTARVRQLQESPVEISGAALGRDLPFIDVRVELLPEAEWAEPGKREFAITARISDEAPVGMYDEWIWVNTNIKRYANMPIKFKGEIVGPYEVMPRAVAVRGVTPGVPSESVLLLRSDKPLNIQDVKNSNPGVQATFRATDQPNTFVFDVNVPERTASRALRDTWTITLDVDGEVHTESVPVTIVLSKED